MIVGEEGCGGKKRGAGMHGREAIKSMIRILYFGARLKRKGKGLR